VENHFCLTGVVCGNTVIATYIAAGIITAVASLFPHLYVLDQLESVELLATYYRFIKPSWFTRKGENHKKETRINMDLAVSPLLCFHGEYLNCS
jgi:hypothetical protein